MRPCAQLKFLLTCGLASSAALRADEGIENLTAAIDVAPVWAAHPVGFCLLTHGDRQFVAFYDADRRMTVGARRLESKNWQFFRLDQRLGWDSHNYVTMAIDENEHLHLSGNMHGHPLVYYRTEEPLKIETFRRIPQMIGREEKRCTYPVFLDGPDGRLIFMYRDGSSGNGNQILNSYDAKTQAWSRLLDAPLFDGQGQRNAYMTGPIRDAAGTYHVAYVWRETGDCATNHDLSYCRSRDLIHWETSRGDPLRLPIMLDTGEIVDAVPAGGGLLNSNVRLGFDSQRRPIITYHKYDAQGFVQVWNARLEDDGWRLTQASNWNTRYEYRGGGSVGGPVRVFPVEVAPGGLKQAYRDADRRTGAWLLDEATLRPIRELRTEGLSGQTRPSSTQPGLPAVRKGGKTTSKPASQPAQPVWMETRTASDLGRGPDPHVRYELRWETRPANRDQPRPGPLPPPTMLRVHAVRTR